jgi:preprotein translocase subunit SecG
MFTFLLTLLILDALLLSVVVLLQAGQGGGLASLGGGSTDTVLGGRQAVTILTKATWWCGGIFMVLSLVLSLVPRAGNSATQLQERLRANSPAVPQPSTTLPLGTPSETGAPAGATPPAATGAKPGATPPAATGAPAPTPAPSPGAAAPKQPGK